MRRDDRLTGATGDREILQDAYEIAQALVDAEIRPSYGSDVVICSCTEFPSAWEFGIVVCIVGSGPVVVPKSGGDPFFGASGSPIEGQIGHL